MVRITVTGGAGFIGSHLTDALSKLGNQVTVLDNLSTGRLANLNRALRSENPPQFLDGDCTRYDDVKHAIADSRIVYHLSARSEVLPGARNPSSYFDNNVLATKVLLSALPHTNVERIVFASTSAVYGDAKNIPTTEESSLSPISIYGGSKAAAEALVTSYARNQGWTAVILRMANIVGSRSRHGVIHDFVEKLRLNPSELEILGDGLQTKSYLHITDCLNAILIAANAGLDENVRTLNVGSADQLEVATIARIVAERMHRENIPLKFTGGVDGGRGWPGDVRNMLLDVSKLRSLGWCPKMNSQQATVMAVNEILGEMFQEVDQQSISVEIPR